MQVYVCIQDNYLPGTVQLNSSTNIFQNC